jgi:sugar lactone lactonase YvrE
VLAAAALVLLTALAVGIAVGVAALRGGGRDAGPAGLNSPEGIALAADGTVYVADTGNNRVVAIHPTTGQVTIVAGDGTAGSSGDTGPATRAQLNGPTAVAVAADGTIYIADNGNGVIRRVVRGIIDTVRPEKGGDVPLSGTSALTVDDQGGRLLIGTEANVYAIGSDGALVTIAGTGNTGLSGNGGQATDAKVDQVEDLAIDSRDGSIYIADYDNNQIRRIVSDGTIDTVAGNGTDNYTGDGQQALDVGLSSPTAVAFDTQGNLYISQSNAVRIVDANGIIRTVIAENDDGFAVVRGRVSGTQFDGIRVRVDVDGNLYLLDAANNRIRKVSADGTTINTIG